MPNDTAATAQKLDEHFGAGMMPTRLRAAAKAVLLVLWFALLMGPLWLAYRFKKFPQRDRIMKFGSKGILAIAGVRVTIHGEMSPSRPLLLVTNHVSYLDICVIGSCGAVHFTPKSEIEAWPVLGAVARMSGAVFVSRSADKLIETKERLKDSLRNGAALCLFPEATTGAGVHVKDFKPGFFSLAQDKLDGEQLQVQPAAVIYKHISGLPIDSTQWPQIAWYGDMELVPHLWQFLCLPSISVELAFLPVAPEALSADRKALARHCQQQISQAIQDSRQAQGAMTHAKPTPFNPIALRKKA